MKIAKIGSILLCCCLILVLIGCNNTSNDTLPNEAQTLVENYMNAFKIGTKDSAEYAYFRNEEIRDAYCNAATILIDYRIEKIEKINQNLYALTILNKTNMTEDAYLKAYNFVGFIDGEWYFINGVGNIPESISENLNKEVYSYRTAQP